MVSTNVDLVQVDTVQEDTDPRIVVDVRIADQDIPVAAMQPHAVPHVANQHAADFKVTGTQLSEFRDEWKCDEYDEELLDLLKEQVENNSVELRRMIEKIRKKMDKLECSRFEDFG